jgi:N-acetylmuramoyl-L-alanine amidase
MMVYVVRQGDYLTRLAETMGFDADSVWQHPDNAALRERRSDPNILAPGDVLRVPRPAPPQHLSVAARTRNAYRATRQRMTLCVVVHDQRGPLANQRYVVESPPPRSEGTTSGSGELTISVSTADREALVSFPDLELRLPIHVAHLDPVTEPSGVWMRLEHLGYLAPRIPGTSLGDAERRSRLADAIESFQRDQGLTVNGVVDEALCSALCRAHGS